MNLRLMKFKIRVFFTGIIKSLIHLAGRALIRPFLRPAPPARKVEDGEITRILFVSLEFRGDLVMSFCAMKALKKNFPRARLTCWTWEYNRSLAELNGYIDEIINYGNFAIKGIGLFGSMLGFGGHRRFIDEIRENKYDLSFDNSGYAFSSYVTFKAGIPLRIGRNVQGFGFLNHFEYPVYRNRNLLKIRLSMLEPLGIKVVDADSMFPWLEIREADIEKVRRNCGLDGPGKYYFTVQPFGGWESKNWGDDKIASVVDSISSEYNMTAAFIGGPDEAGRIDSIIDRTERSGVNCAGRISAGESAALIGGATVHFGVDSFGGQVASSVGTPSLIIFGPTNPRLIMRTGPKNIAVAKRTACSPRVDRLYCCADGGRSCRKLTCLTDLSADEVLSVFRPLLDGKTVEEITEF